MTSKDLSSLKAKRADVAFIVEGSYPFVRGGVAAWTHQLLEAFSDINFALVFLGSNKKSYQEPKYELPKNVVRFDMCYLYEAETQVKVNKGNPFELMNMLLKSDNTDKAQRLYDDLNFFINLNKDIKFLNAFATKKNWNFIITHYEKYCTDPSFVNYFWSILNIQEPLWQMAKLAANFIPVKFVHAASTGFAGFFSSLLNHYYGYNTILTEHGIYTKERRIDLLNTDVALRQQEAQEFFYDINYIRALWIRFFEFLAKLCYSRSNPIISLYETASEKQIEEGADKTKTQVIPNGVNVKKFAAYRAKNFKAKAPNLCLFGRITPIKDVTTFIRAIKILAKHLPEIKGWVLGPLIEADQRYFEECKDLIATLDLSKNIFVTPGFFSQDHIFPNVELMILSSISEGMPLTVLEGFASGIPAVTTDVGACRNLIYGHNEEDRALGKAGEVVPIANPDALANGILPLISSEEVWQKARDVAIQRVEKYYDEKIMFQKYRNIYNHLDKNKNSS
jgi:glycosyltransferase involved in cell wall biosynthesis